MNNIIKYIGGALVLLVIYTLVLRFLTPEFLIEKVEVKVETEVDIDSSQVYKEYSERIPEAEIDTVYADTLEIPVPVPIDEERNQYTINYSDSLLSARWITTVLGELENQEFEYFLRRRIVREDRLTITNTITTTRTETITKVRAPRPYFTVGAELTDLQGLSLSAGYMTRSRYHIYYRRDFHWDTHNIGIQMPLKFNLRSII